MLDQKKANNKLSLSMSRTIESQTYTKTFAFSGLNVSRRRGVLVVDNNASLLALRIPPSQTTASGGSRPKAAEDTKMMRRSRTAAKFRATTAAPGKGRRNQENCIRVLGRYKSREDMEREEYMWGRQKWMDKRGFICGGRWRGYRMLDNYIASGSGPCQPSVLHKFRDENKGKWIAGAFK